MNNDSHMKVAGTTIFDIVIQNSNAQTMYVLFFISRFAIPYAGKTDNEINNELIHAITFICITEESIAKVGAKISEYNIF